MNVSLSGVQEDVASNASSTRFDWNDNPMREGGGEGGEGDAGSLMRTRINTFGSNNIPVLTKKAAKKAGEGGPGATAAPSPPPPPPPVGWSRAIDPQGREYFWHNESGKTSWTIEGCTM